MDFSALKLCFRKFYVNAIEILKNIVYHILNGRRPP